MYLAKLDSNNVVIAAIAAADIPMLIPLDSSYIAMATLPTLGLQFDPETKQFAPAPRKRWVTKLAFDSRFTMPEAVALKVAQAMPAQGPEETNEAYQARCITAASVQVLQSRLNMASYIDLDREDTRQGVILLETMGLLGEGRALEILDGPIADHEYHPTA